MRTQLTVLLAAAVIAALALVLVGPSSGSSRHARRDRTLRLLSKLVSSKFLDNPPKSKSVVSPGDSYVFVRTLFDKSGQNRVGSLHVSCIATSGGRTPWFQCDGTYALAAGHIAATALFHTSVRRIPIAIIGGTGAYEGIQGSATETGRGRTGIVADEILHLLS
jgi:hypothetical protein